MEPKEHIERLTLERLASDNPTVKDVAEGVKMVIRNLWSKDELTALIVQTHNTLCTKCPARVYMTGTSGGDEAQEDKKWFQKVIWALIGIGGAAVGYLCK